jgi:putative DNA primase/helicase
LAFALKDGITFIDIDHAIKDGEIVSKEAKRLLELLPDTYTEKSVSGTGIHILLKGSLPPDAYRRNDRKGIEMYDSRRFICMTGDIMNSGREIKDYADIIAQIAYEFTGKRPPIKEYTSAPATQSDTALIEQISNSRSGAKFQALYGGDTSGYSSHSHAESALVFMLAWWSRSSSQIDGIVRSSGLIRPKWDERRGNTTYGSQLINEALSIVSPRQEKKQEYYL